MNQEEELLQANEAFILRTASFVLGRPVSRSDDEYSVALSAFWEAARTHDPSKGSLQTYASVVIRHRLIDYIRGNTRYRQEISVEPDVFSGEAGNESADENLRNEIGKKLVQELPDNQLAQEINELSAILRYYQIDFSTCPDAARKRTKPVLSVSKRPALSARLPNCSPVCAEH